MSNKFSDTEVLQLKALLRERQRRQKLSGVERAVTTLTLVVNIVIAFGTFIALKGSLYYYFSVCLPISILGFRRALNSFISDSTNRVTFTAPVVMLKVFQCSIFVMTIGALLLFYAQNNASLMLISASLLGFSFWVMGYFECEVAAFFVRRSQRKFEKGLKSNLFD